MVSEENVIFLCRTRISNSFYKNLKLRFLELKLRSLQLKLHFQIHFTNTCTTLCNFDAICDKPLRKTVCLFLSKHDFNLEIQKIQ